MFVVIVSHTMKIHQTSDTCLKYLRLVLKVIGQFKVSGTAIIEWETLY